MTITLETRAPAEADLPDYAALYAEEELPDPEVGTVDYFRWKFLANPQGRAHSLHLREDGKLIGMFVLTPRLYRHGGETIVCAYAVNLLVRKDKRSIGTLNTILRGVKSPPGFDFLMSTPNAVAIPIWERFLKYPIPFELDVHVTPLRPARLLARSERGWAGLFTWGDPVAKTMIASLAKLRSGATASVGSWPDLEKLSEFQNEVRAGRTGGVCDPAFLKWRFIDAPFEYQPVVVNCGQAIAAFGILRTLQYGGYRATAIVEACCTPGDSGAGAALLSGAVDCAARDNSDLLIFLGIDGAPDIAPALRFPMLKAPRQFLPQRVPVVIKNYDRSSENRPQLHAFTRDSFRLSLADCDMF